MRLAFSELKAAVIALVLATAVLAWVYPLTSLIPLVFLAYLFYFFRDPEREIAAASQAILAPADGVVTRIAPIDCPYSGTGSHQVSIFMSPLNVHVNRSPIAGAVESVSHQPGKYLPAMNPNAPLVNERRLYCIQGLIRITVTQVAGILARRTVSWVGKGQQLAQGERFGMIKLGSCVQVTFPGTCAVVVAEGDRVKAGLSIIGEVNPCKE